MLHLIYCLSQRISNILIGWDLICIERSYALSHVIELCVKVGFQMRQAMESTLKIQTSQLKIPLLHVTNFPAILW